MPSNQNDSGKITPAHDEIASFKRSQKKGLASRFGEVPDGPSVGSSTGMKTLLTIIVVALTAAGVWSVLLNNRLQSAEKVVMIYEARISELEKRLSITDEDMTDSQVSMQVKMKEMDSEIRKLWDNVWKKSKAQLAKHDATLKKHESFISGAKKQLNKNDTVIKDLKAQFVKARNVETVASSNQKKIAVQESRMELTSDKVNSVRSDMNKLNRRVKETEEWVDSINGFRKQVNRDIGTLKKSVGQLQSKSTAGSAP